MRLRLGFFPNFILKLIVGLFLLSTSEHFALAQLLSNARSEIRPLDRRDNEQVKDDKEAFKDGDHRRRNFGSNLIGEFLGAMFCTPSKKTSREDLRGDRLGTGEGYDINYEIYTSEQDLIFFPSYPYSLGQGGGIVCVDTGKSMRVQSASWYGTDFNNIDTWNAQMKFEGQKRIGFEFQWAFITEKLTGLPRDSLSLADFNLTYRWIQQPEIVLRTGFGLNYMVDRLGSDTGYNLTLSSEIFPVEPWVLGIELDYGEVGAARQTHLLSTAGLNFNRSEILIGYEYRRIGNVHFDGPLLGFRFWW